MTTPPQTTFYEKVLTKYGLATFLAVFLVGWLTMGVSGKIDAIKSNLDDHVSETAHYLRAICLHVSKDDAERAECSPPPARR